MAINKVGSKGVEDGAVAAADFKNADITAAKLNSTLDLSSKTVTLPNTSVTSGQLAGSIANAKLSNSTVTLSGQSVALGASGSLNNFFVDWQSKVTSDGSTVTTMVAGKGYFVDNSSAAGIVKLPAAASAGDFLAIKDYAGNFATNKLTIQRNSHKIQGSANDGLLQTNRASVTLVYVDATKGWLYVDEHNVADLQLNQFTTATGGTVSTSGDDKIHVFTGDGNFVVSQVGAGTGPSTVDYMVIAGGGGSYPGDGNYTGGGGAGGYRASGYGPSPLRGSALPISTQTYPITVGGGGTGNGNTSTFSTISSAGGGIGGFRAGAAGQAGGSGGGGAGVSCAPHTQGGAGNTPPVSPPQGNAGGNGVCGSTPPRQGAGGGGGAGTAGSNGSSSSGGNGGNGVPNTITASDVTYAGGGGGGAEPNGGPGTDNTAGGSGGPGGGGNGLSNYHPPWNLGANNSGAANTGGGAGGVRYLYPTPFSNLPTGGKGIVVIRYKYQ